MNCNQKIAVVANGTRAEDRKARDRQEIAVEPRDDELLVLWLGRFCNATTSGVQFAVCMLPLNTSLDRSTIGVHASGSFPVMPILSLAIRCVHSVRNVI